MHIIVTPAMMEDAKEHPGKYWSRRAGMTVTVTADDVTAAQADIAAGKQFSTCCIIAQAMKRTLGGEVEVSVGYREAGYKDAFGVWHRFSLPDDIGSVTGVAPVMWSKVKVPFEVEMTEFRTEFRR